MIDMIFSTLIDVSSKLTQTNDIAITGSELNCILVKLRELNLTDSDAYHYLDQFQGVSETKHTYATKVINEIDTDKKRVFEQPKDIYSGVDYQFRIDANGNVKMLTNKVLKRVLASVNVTKVV